MAMVRFNRVRVEGQVVFINTSHVLSVEEGDVQGQAVIFMNGPGTDNITYTVEGTAHNVASQIDAAQGRHI